MFCGKKIQFSREKRAFYRNFKVSTSRTFNLILLIGKNLTG